MRSNLNPKLTILASTENTDLDNKKKYGTLNRGLRAIASNFKLKRNLSTGRLSGKEEVKITLGVIPLSSSCYNKAERLSNEIQAKIL